MRMYSVLSTLLPYTGQYRSAAKYMDTATMNTMNTMATAENCIVGGWEGEGEKGRYSRIACVEDTRD